MRRLGWLVACLWLAGCVTESTGGLPGPADTAERVQAQLDLARGYLEKRDYQRARPPLNRALQINARSVEAHVLMGVLNQAEGEAELAENHYQSALRIDPADSQALNNYGTFLFAEGRFDEAVEQLRKLVRNADYRARSQAYENLGLAELRLGNRERAKQAFTRAVLLDEGQSWSHLELAELAYDATDYPSAEQHYDQFRRGARQTPRSLCLGMKLSHVSGDTDRLASYALALQNLFPQSAHAKSCEVP